MRARSKAAANPSLVGLWVGARTISSPGRQPAGSAWRVIVRAPRPTAPVTRVQASLGAPARSRAPLPITHRPTSVGSTSMVLPTALASSAPVKTRRWLTSAEAGRMTSRPWTTTLPALSSRRLDRGSKISRPPASTVTPATRASTSRVIGPGDHRHPVRPGHAARPGRRVAPAGGARPRRGRRRGGGGGRGGQRLRRRPVPPGADGQGGRGGAGGASEGEEGPPGNMLHAAPP